MNRSVNEPEIRIVVQESLGCLWTSMRRTVIDDPEDPSRLAIGATLHDLIHKAIKRRDAAVGFATTKDLSAVDIEGCQIGPGPKPFVFVFDSHGPVGLWGQGLMFSETRLDAGLFVRTENELIGLEFTALPEALVEIQNSAGFLFEVWVSRKNPATVLPRTDGVLVEPTPYGGIAEGCCQTSAPHIRSEFGYTPTRKGHASDGGKLTSDSLNADDQFWGGKTRGRPGRWQSSRPAKRLSKNRFRHMLTISRRVLRRSAI
jgi:hypothetical protein